jgi:hypothetical protein
VEQAREERLKGGIGVMRELDESCQPLSGMKGLSARLTGPDVEMLLRDPRTSEVFVAALQMCR